MFFLVLHVRFVSWFGQEPKEHKRDPNSKHNAPEHVPVRYRSNELNKLMGRLLNELVSGQNVNCSSKYSI